MTSVVCARLGAVRVPGATSSPRCAQKLDMPTCTTFAGPELHKTSPKRSLGGFRQPNLQALALSLSRTSFLGAGGHGLLGPLTCNGRTGSAKFQVVAIKRGGGPRRRTREANPMEQASKGPKMNEAVLAYPNIRLLDQDQKMIGIVASSDALLAARNKELDLVLIAGDADPPVCRIMDYTKYKYEKDKKARDTLKRSKANRVDQKELKMRYNTDVGDYNTTLRKCMRFLRAGDKVKFSMNFKAREMGFQKQGITLFEKVQADIGEWGVTEGRITVEGRNILLMVGPNKPYIERMRREEAKAGKVVDEDSSDDEEEEQESEEVDSDDDEEDNVSGEDDVSREDDVRGEEVASNGAAVQSQSTPAAVQ